MIKKEVDIQKAIELHKLGRTLKEICQVVGLADHRELSRRMKAAGYEVKDNRVSKKISEDKVRELIDKYNNGATITDLSKDPSINIHNRRTIANLLKKNDVQLRSNSATVSLYKERIREEKYNNLITDFTQDVDIFTLSSKYNITPFNVKKILLEAGISIDEIVRPYIKNISEPGEIWKECPLLDPKYRVSNKGRILTVRPSTSITEIVHLLKPWILKSASSRRGKEDTISTNYYRLSKVLSREGNVCNFSLHRLVAVTFIPNTDPNKTDIDHINHNGLDNRVENLRWVSVTENNHNKR